MWRAGPTATLQSWQFACKSGYNSLPTDIFLKRPMTTYTWSGIQNSSINYIAGDIIEVTDVSATSLRVTLSSDAILFSGAKGVLTLRSATATLADLAGLTFQFTDGSKFVYGNFTDTATVPLYGLGNASANSLYGGSAGDVLDGGDGNDTLFGGAGNDVLNGGMGNDRLHTQGGRDTVSGGDGDDELDARSKLVSDAWVNSSDAVLLDGGAGADQIFGGLGNDTILGGSGDDRIYGGDGIDTINGGSGNDTIDTNGRYDYSAKAWVGTLQSSRVDGGEGNDLIIAGAGNDTLSGGDGNDNINGGDGADTITGGAGNDTLQGGAGADTLDGGTGADYVDGGEGNDSVNGGAGNDTLRGGAGLDTLAGGDGADSLVGEDGNDVLAGADGNDSLFGGSGNDQLDAGAGDDYLDGEDGDDSVSGGTGNDTLNGGAGNDFLDGGEGADTMDGGSGFDTYIIDNHGDTVYDADADSKLVVKIDWYKAPSNFTNIEYQGQKLPYWIDSLQFFTGSGIGQALGSGGVIHYYYADAPLAGFTEADKEGFTSFNATQKTYTQRAFDYASSLFNVRFEEVTDASLPYTIVLGNNVQKMSGGYANTVYKTGFSVLMMNIETYALNPDLDHGHNFNWVFLHELGHALGLKHPFSHADANVVIGPGPYLSDAEDSKTYTVMSYTDVPTRDVSTYAPLDIAALQATFGPAAGAHGGDSTYKLDPGAANFIWDGSGIDTLDGSALAQALRLYLEPGYWGYIGKKADLITAAGQVTINFGSAIENASGGSGNDTISGNALDNTLSGGNGDDVLEGGQGNDRLDGGNGLDTAYYNGLRSAYTVTEQGSGTWLVAGSEGTDTLVNIESLRFADTTLKLTATLPDTTPPAAPTVLAAGGAAIDRRVFSGLAEAYATVEVFDGATRLGAVNADGNGAWTFSSGLLAEGVHAITARATDAAGNISASSSALAVTITVPDTVPPAAPTLAVTDGVFSNRPVLSGTSEAYARIDLFDGVTKLGTTTATASGAWTYTPDLLANGSHNITAQATDAAGNASQLSAAATVAIASLLNRTGTAGADTIGATAGNNYIDGGNGTDTVIFSGNRANFTIAKTGASTGAYTVTDQAGTGGTDVLVNVERLQFGDKMVGFDVTGNGGQAYRLYQAAFDRAPDQAGLGFWIKALDSGFSLRDAAAGFIASPEFASLYGSNPSNTAFITKLYNNVLHRAPEQEGFDFWLNAMNNHIVDQAEILVQFSESQENQAQLLGVIGSGFDYVAYTGA